jgi:hypothetical protein
VACTPAERSTTGASQAAGCRRLIGAAHERPFLLVRHQQAGRLDRTRLAAGDQSLLDRAQQPLGEVDAGVGDEGPHHRRRHSGIVQDVSGGDAIGAGGGRVGAEDAAARMQRGPAARVDHRHLPVLDMRRRGDEPAPRLGRQGAARDRGRALAADR